MPVPKAPLFTVSEKPRFIDFEPQAQTHAHVTRLALLQNADSGCLAYDAAGHVWSFRYERRPGGFSVLERLLAHTFYNPVSRVSITWEQLRPYSFDELRQHYLDAIAADDDILTQFVETEELSARVRACSSFDQLVATWAWQSTDSSFTDESEKTGIA